MLLGIEKEILLEISYCHTRE